MYYFVQRCAQSKKGSLKMEVFLMVHVHSKFLNVMYIHVCVVHVATFHLRSKMLLVKEYNGLFKTVYFQ